jgi:hypothetical protein
MRSISWKSHSWKWIVTMTIEDLIGVLMDILPEAQIGEDEDGQIVIYTGLQMPSEAKAYPQPNQR